MRVLHGGGTNEASENIMTKLKVAVLISGRGSNMLALVEAAKAADCPFTIVGVISNKSDAAGLALAAAAGLPTACISRRDFSDKAACEAALDAALNQMGAQLVCLAGFMRILSPWFAERWRDRLINIHPSLLPAFPGLHVHAKVLEYGVKFTGCTVHFIRAEMDVGPIIAQAVVPVLSDDDEDTLAARVLIMEHKIYPMVVRLIAEGRVNVLDERVFITGEITFPTSISSPSVV